MYVELIQNTSLIVALTSLYGLLSRLNRFGKTWSKVLSGLLFGGVAIIGMQLPFHYTSGVIYDGRSITLAMAGLFGGGTAAVVSTILAGAYRAHMGGAGVWAGIGTIIGCAGVGLALRRSYGNRPDRIGILSLYGFGISVHVVMLACQLFIQPWPSGIAVINRIWLPIMLIFPAVTVLMGLFLGTEERRIQAELSLRESESLLSNSQSIGHIGSWEYNVDKNRLTWSDEVYRIFGFRPQEFAATFEAFLDIVHPDDRASVDATYQESIKERNDGYQIEHRIIHRDTGEIRIIHEKCEHLKNASGRIVRSVGMVQDITERKRAEEALQRSEALYRLVVENINDIIWTFELSSMTYTFVSPSVQRILGYADETMVKNLDVVFTPVTKRHVLKTFENFMKGYTEGDILVLGAEHRKKDGSLIWMEISASPLKDDFGKIVGFLGTSRNIAERKLAEEMLLESEIKYRRLFEAAKDGILILDAETGMIVDVNPFLVELLGYSSELFLGKTVWDIGFFKDIIKNKDKFLELQEKEYVRYDDLPLETAHGKVIDVEFISNVYDIDHKKVIQCNIRDITERKQAEKEKVKFETRLLQVQKMEAIGSLAGGIAHDLNNILFPISGFSEMLLDEIPPDSHAYKSIEQIYKSAKRGGDLVNQILAFSRQSNLQKLPIRIQPILKEVLKLVRATITKNIEITSDIKKDCGKVSADSTQIHQIAMNLITNAYHAVEENGGSINIELKETEFGRDDLHDNVIKPGKYVILSVSDTGTGIDQALIDKIFDPYFTTKEQGKGTGLGLSVVHGIVKEHGGDIRVNSKVGKGTTFHVFLPLLKEVMESKTAAVVREYPTGTENILLVDDEEPIAKMVQMMLERLGYKVTARTSSPDALDAFKANPSKFDLVISDRGMPNMTGEQLAWELISIKPEIPIIICTGFSDENDEKRAKEIGIKGFLIKPVAIGDLADIVRKALDDVNGSTRK